MTAVAIKIDRSRWDHDPEAVEVRADSLIAGDYVAELGIVDAILRDGLHTLLLCSGTDAWQVWDYSLMTAHGAICPDCDMHPDDCRYYGCTRAAEIDQNDGL